MATRVAAPTAELAHQEHGFTPVLTPFEESCKELSALLSEWAKQKPPSFASVKFQSDLVLQWIGPDATHPVRQALGSSGPLVLVGAIPGRETADDECEQPFWEELVYVGPEDGLALPGLMPEKHGRANSLHHVPHSLAPLSFDDARYAVSLFSCVANCPPNVPVLAFARQQDHVQFFGTMKRVDNRSNETSVKSFSLKARSTPLGISAIPKLDAFGLQECAGQKDELLASAVYDIVSPSATLDMENRELLRATFAWKSCSQTLATPPFSSTVELQCRAVPGSQTRGSTKALVKDLDLLTDLVEIIEELQAGGKPEDVWPTESFLVSEQLDAFFDSLGDSNAPYQPIQRKIDDSAQSEDEDDGLGTVSLTATRGDLDFTERLWLYVRHANGFEDLRRCLGRAMQRMMRGGDQLAIHRNNPTEVASLANRCLRLVHAATFITGQAQREYQQQESELQATMRALASDPLKILRAVADIGLHKLVRDYEHVFVGTEMITASQLDFFCHSGQDISEKLERLRRLHNVLELHVMVSTFLDLPKAAARDMILSGLEYYQAHPSSYNPVFVQRHASFSAAASQLKKAVAEMVPTVWSASCHVSRLKKTNMVQLLNVSAATYLDYTTAGLLEARERSCSGGVTKSSATYVVVTGTSTAFPVQGGGGVAE